MFEAALAEAPADRAAWLAARTGPELAAEVEAMLTADAATTPLLDDPERMLSLDADEGAPPAEPVKSESERIGAFEVRGVLGEGRSGVVYRAWQSSPPREVALKVLRSSVWSTAGGHRFATEGRALARLSHPGIARIYETGEFREPGGVRRPFLVMELVEGARLITEGVRGLALDARIAVLADLCAAVAHAHQRGVLHRDLKPGNVLVDASGQVKVIDFGIARLDEDGPRATVAGQLLGTPAYMSPEQASGREADTRTDVYAIGLIARDVLGGGVAGDLAVVVAKATAREPDGRYQSVGELAADLDRVRSGRPILARPPSPWYTFRMLVRRNRAVSLAITAGVLGLLGGVVTLVVSGQRIARANEDARDSAAFLLDNVLARLEDRIGSAAERRRLAQQLLPRVERLAVRSGDDGVWASKARLLRILGDADQEEGRFLGALEHLRRAKEIREDLARALPDDRDRMADLSIAIVRVGDVLKDLGEPAAQLEHYRRAMDIDRALVARFPADARLASNLAYSCQRLGMKALERGEGEAAERLAHEQVQIATRLLDADPENPRRLREATEARATHGAVLRILGRGRESVQSIEQQLAIAEHLARADPDSRKSAVNLISVLLSASGAEAGEGRHDRAIEYCERALTLARRQARSDPGDTEIVGWIARLLLRKTGSLASAGPAENAVAAFREALETTGWLDAKLGDGVEKATLWRDVMESGCVVLNAADRRGEADALARRAAARIRDLAAQGSRADRRACQLMLTDALSALADPSPLERAEVADILARYAADDGPRTVLDAARRLLRAGALAAARDAADRVLRIAAPEQTLFLEEARACRDEAVRRMTP